MHDVRFSIPERELGKADIEFKIKKGNQKFGTLRVSKGTIVWLPKANRFGFKMSWNKFDEVMQNQKRREKR